ncbi:DUF4912 domain-containing protein [bacterium]|nr:DUF4912 domain-containing protein [bacterium]
MKRTVTGIPWKKLGLRALRNLARIAGIRGRSRMKRDELVRAVKKEAAQKNVPKAAIEAAAKQALAGSSTRPPEKPRAERPPAKPAAPFIDRGQAIPLTYGRDVLRLLARDPDWLFAYWELTPRRLAELRGTYKDILETAWHLRLVEAETGFGAMVPVFVGACSWYLRARPRKRYHVELGFTHGQRFVPVLSSNQVRTPRSAISDSSDEDWMALKQDLTRLMRVDDESVLLGPGRVFASAERYREVTEAQLEMLRKQAAGVKRAAGVGSGAHARARRGKA